MKNYEVELLVYTVLNYESPVSCYWFGKMKNRPWFSIMESDLKIAILKQAKSIPPNSKDCFILFETFRDFDFYKSLIEQNDSLFYLKR